MNTDETGRFSAMYKPFHLIGLELNISILAASLLGKATGSTKAFNADVVATAKRHLKAGEILDGEGGHTVWGKLYPARRSLQIGGLPIGLAQNVKLRTYITENSPVRWQDVEIDHNLEAIKIRRTLEQDPARLHP